MVMSYDLRFERSGFLNPLLMLTYFINLVIVSLHNVCVCAHINQLQRVLKCFSFS